MQKGAAIRISPKNRDSLEGYQMLTYIEIYEQTHTFFFFFLFDISVDDILGATQAPFYVHIPPCGLAGSSPRKEEACAHHHGERSSLFSQTASPKLAAGRVVPSTPQSGKYPTAKLLQAFWQESKVPTFILSN